MGFHLLVLLSIVQCWSHQMDRRLWIRCMQPGRNLTSLVRYLRDISMRFLLIIGMQLLTR